MQAKHRDHLLSVALPELRHLALQLDPVKDLLDPPGSVDRLAVALVGS